jgi:quercetin dioxygenase-like cupin family protein
MPKLTGFSAISAITSERISDKISRRIASGDQGMLVWWSVKAGAHAAAHSHPHEQLVWVTSGLMDLRIGAEQRSCGPGDIAVIPGGVEHEVWFREDTEVVDVFSPPREDFLAGGPPPYMSAAAAP